MYKVFVFNKLIILSNEPETSAYTSSMKQVEAVSRKIIKEAYSNFVNNNKEEILLLYNKSGEKKLLEEFISLFWYVEAAGGMVYNSNQERLFIYRFGKWDLPKGKIEKNETHEEAAIREVQEETGLLELAITEELPSTFHIFDYKGKKVLKRTYWYKMQYTGTDEPKPQLEEDIKQAVWVKDSDISKILENTYGSLKLLLSGGLV